LIQPKREAKEERMQELTPGLVPVSMQPSPLRALSFLASFFPYVVF
jgi:hypothetical protein